MASATFELLQHRLDVSDLHEWIKERRAEGQSYETIAKLLSIETGISVSLFTVRRWHKDAA